MRQISIPDQLFDQLSALARPFVDKEPADVIRWLAEKELKIPSNSESSRSEQTHSKTVAIEGRLPRERGAVVKIDGTTLRADSVPDLIAKVTNHLYESGKWERVLELAPFKTSAQRYLYSKTPKHPNGNDFWVEIRNRELIFEGHKNYKTTIEQLSRLVSKCGMSLTYLGSH